MTNDFFPSPTGVIVDAANFGANAFRLALVEINFLETTETTPSQTQVMKIQTTQTLRKVSRNLATLLALVTAPAAFAASQIWSNAPVNANWNTAANWIGNAVPGAINQTGNTVNNDVATFNSPLFGGIGGAGNPILTDDATVLNLSLNRARTFGGITFDTPNVGAYVIQAGNPFINISDTNFVGSGVFYVSHNGSIQMTAGVTNNQTILGPVRVRLPSSTAGIYNLVNNSTNLATLFISAITNDSANSRGTDFRLGGSNPGTNTIGVISAGTTTTGGNGLTKQGSGTWILAAANDLRSQTVVRILDGTLIVKDPGAFSLATSVTVTNPGILQIDAVNLFQPTLNLQKGGTIRMNGTESLNGVAVGTHVATDVNLATTSASDVFTVGTALLPTSVVAGGAADSVLNTAGPGTLVFGQANTYIGRWSFNAATNQITNPSALSTGANADVGAGATFDITVFGASTFTPTTAGFGGSGFGTTVGSSAAAVVADAGGTLDLTSKNINLNFNPASFSGDTTRPALYIAQGTLAISGNTFFINNTSGTPLGVGTYRLIQQASGSISSGGGYAALISGSGMVGGAAASIVVSGGNVDLVVNIYVPKNLVWSGTGSAWDVNSTADWLDGVIASVFNNSDNVTFNSVGAANPAVSLSGTLAPATVTVDTSANDYTFTGSGSIAGTTSLVKDSAGTLNLITVNTYAGGTVVSNGTLRVGVNNAIASVGTGDVAVYGAGVLDLNGFNNTINGLVGNGTVDIQSGGASVLTVGNNDDSGTFTGVLKNTSGTLAFTKTGTGSQSLTSSNSHSGPSTLDGGTLSVSNPNALGTANDVVVNGGTLNIQTSITVNSLAGLGGTIANNSTATTNRILITGSTATTLGGSVVDGSGGGGVGITLLGGTLTMSGNSTYTGGTLVGSGATFAIPNSPAAVGGFVVASNGAILALSGGSGTPGTPNSVTTVAGAKVLFTSGAEGKIWNAQFNGSVNSTNRFLGPVSAGQSLSFSNFPGVVEFANTNDANLNFRFFNGAGVSGGENTLFVFERVNLHTRDTQTVRLGSVAGGNSLAGINDQAGVATWEIGAKNTSDAFHGYIRGTNTIIVKVGTGTLTLDGVFSNTNVVTLPDPFEPTNIVTYILSTNVIHYYGATVVSNGTLKVVAPNNLTTSPSITLAGGTLDATQIGFVTNQTTLDYNSVEQATNAVIVTSGVVQILAGQSLNGQGSLLGSVTTDPASTMNVGNPTGTLAISGSISLNGTVNMSLDRSNLAQNSDRITAASFSGAGAVLNVTNAGPTLIAGTVFQLFSGPVSAFTTVNLPASDASGLITYTWQNNIAVNGSVTLLTGLSATPVPLTSVINGSNLELSWPLDHTGWTLQAQTNALNVGLTSTWATVGGSTTTNQVIVPVNPANPTVFYRLALPLP
jgi:fibronectin-binding autotransporter adhesin